MQREYKQLNGITVFRCVGLPDVTTWLTDHACQRRQRLAWVSRQRGGVRASQCLSCPVADMATVAADLGRRKVCTRCLAPLAKGQPCACNQEYHEARLRHLASQSVTGPLTTVNRNWA